jgi:hypothetical protein
VRSARAAGGERPDGGDPRMLARQGKRLGPPQPDALKMGFREAVDRLPAHRRYPSPSQVEERPSLTRSTTSTSRTPTFLFPVSRFFETPLLSSSCSRRLHAQDFDPRWSLREWSARQFAKQLQIADWLASRFLETDRAKAPFD